MKPTIQIIDDNVALTTLLAKTLSKFGYKPVVDNNPLLAINSARHHLPDLILLDVMMPERDGGRVLADLRADLSLRYIPVVLLTAIAREAQALADTGGIQSVILSKPVQLKELMSTIKSQLLESGSDHSLSDETSPTDSPLPELPDFEAITGPPQRNTAPLELPGREEETFSNPGPRADAGFSPDTPPASGPDFSFPDRTTTDSPTENPW